MKFNQNYFSKLTYYAHSTSPAHSRFPFFDLHFSIFILCLPWIFHNFWFMKIKSCFVYILYIKCVCFSTVSFKNSVPVRNGSIFKSSKRLRIIAIWMSLPLNVIWHEWKPTLRNGNCELSSDIWNLSFASIVMGMTDSHQDCSYDFEWKSIKNENVDEVELWKSCSLWSDLYTPSFFDGFDIFVNTSEASTPSPNTPRGFFIWISILNSPEFKFGCVRSRV